jgi:hypothetical protein
MLNNQNIIACFSALLAVLSLQAQNRTLQYDYSNNRFGQNQPLPAEEPWTLSGQLPNGIDMVEVTIYQSDELDDDPIYSSEYRLPRGNESDQFTIPINRNLRGNETYTITISYFKRAGDSEVQRLRQTVVNSLRSYIEISSVADKNDIELTKHPQLMIQDMNQIVDDGLSLYRSKVGNEFPGFSEIVYDKLEQIDDLSLRKAKFNVFNKDEDQNERQKRVQYFNENIDQLVNLVERETSQFLGNEFFVLEQVRIVRDYRTEKTRNVIPINVGYAAVFSSNQFNDLEDFDNSQYDGSVMVGLSVPLGNPYLSDKFWHNSSISAGVLLQNIEFADVEYTGPVVDTPLYLAYGYKTAYFIRLNVGTAILTEKGGNDKIEFSPFIGVSAEINLWLGLSR